MGLHYSSQIILPLIGTKSGTTRTSVAITNAYDNAATTKIIPTGGMSKVNLDILYTMGAAETANSIEIRVESSSDGVNFYRLPNDNTSGGTSTLLAREWTFVGTNAAAAMISLPIDIYYKFARFSFKETGVAANAGTIFVDYTLSGK